MITVNINGNDLKSLTDNELGMFTGACLAEIVNRHGIEKAKVMIQSIFEFDSLIRDLRKDLKE